MTMPAFTAEASLYKTSGRYRTHRGGPAFRMISPIWPAAVKEDIVGREVIVIRDPWRHLTEPPVIIDWGGGGGGGGVFGEGPGGPGGGGGTTKPPKIPKKIHPCRIAEYTPATIQCEGRVPADPDPKFRYTAFCSDKGGKRYCCLVSIIGMVGENPVYNLFECDDIS